jgi:hypothetical protein
MVTEGVYTLLTMMKVGFFMVPLRQDLTFDAVSKITRTKFDIVSQTLFR